jgi:eukaryotic-like serine/threonine-protein kinase
MRDSIALSGDLAQAQTLANDLERRFPVDTSVKFNYVPVLRALWALQHHHSRRAIELLEINVPYELAIPGIDFFANVGGLYPVYVRGEAYRAAHRGVEAAAEFQKILDHRGLVVADPVGALASLQRGRALLLTGEQTKAKAAYQDVLKLWKEADPNLPILKQAQAEFARLQ